MLDTIVDFDVQDHRGTLRGGTQFFYKILGLTNSELDFHLGGLSNLETPPILDQDGVTTASARIDQLCFGDSSGISLRLGATA